MSEEPRPTGKVTVEVPGGLCTIEGSHMCPKDEIGTRMRKLLDGDDVAKYLGTERNYSMRIFPKDTKFIKGRDVPEAAVIKDPTELQRGVHVSVGNLWVFKVLSGNDNKIAASAILAMRIDDGKWYPAQQGRVGVPITWCLENNVRPRFIPPNVYSGWTEIVHQAVGNMYLETNWNEVVPIDPKTKIYRDLPGESECGLLDWMHEYYAVKLERLCTWPEVFSDYRMKVVSVISNPDDLQYQGPESPRCILHNGGMVFMLAPTGAMLIAHYDGETQTFCDAGPDLVSWKLVLGDGPIVLRDIRTYLFSEPEFKAVQVILSVCANRRALQIRAEADVPQTEDAPALPLMGPYPEWTGKFTRLYRGEFYRYIQLGVKPTGREGKMIGRRFVLLSSSSDYAWSIMTCQGMFWERDFVSKLYRVKTCRESYTFFPALDGTRHIIRIWNHVDNSWQNIVWPDEIDFDSEGTEASGVIRGEPMKDEAINAKTTEMKKRRNSSKSSGLKK